MSGGEPNDSPDRMKYEDVVAESDLDDDQDTTQEPMVGDTVDLSPDEPTPENNEPLDPDVEQALEEYYEYKENAGESVDEDDTTDDSDSQSDSTDNSNSSSTSATSDTDESDTEQESIGDYDPDDPPASFSDVAVSIDDVDVDLDEQEWELGNPIEPQVIPFKGMHFELREPDEDDQIENALQGIDSDSPLPQRKVLTQLIVNRPTISDERWNEGMTPTERFALSNHVLSFLNQGNFTNS